MRIRIRVVAAGLSAWMLTGAAVAAPSVEVSFVAPEQYADAGRGSERDAALEELRRGFVLAAGRHLKDGDRLAVEVLDVDLAGRLEPTRGFAREVRVLRDVDAPRLRLRYVLERGSRRSEGEARLTDLGYLSDPLRCRAGEPFCHELRLIDSWLSALAPSLE